MEIRRSVLQGKLSALTEQLGMASSKRMGSQEMLCQMQEMNRLLSRFNQRLSHIGVTKKR